MFTILDASEKNTLSREERENIFSTKQSKLQKDLLQNRKVEELLLPFKQTQNDSLGYEDWTPFVAKINLPTLVEIENRCIKDHWKKCIPQVNGIRYHLIYGEARDVFGYCPLTGIICNNLTGKTYVMPRGAYKRIMYKNSYFLAHRLAWLLYYGTWPSQQIDHINGLKHDNRIVNLRDVSPSTNMHNNHVNRYNKTGFAGVRLIEKSGLFRATLRVLDQVYNLGDFPTAELAHQAYKKEKALL